MIDQLPEHRTLPDDVRMRARRKLSEGMSPAPSARTPALIAAGVSVLAAGAVFAGQAVYGPSELAAPTQTFAQNGELVGKDRAVLNHVERGKVAPGVLARCAAAAKAHPPSSTWQTIATSRKHGTTLTAFRVPAGVFFCANTATTTTISAPDDTKLEPGRGQVKMLFNTQNGTLAGLVSPDVEFLSLSRIGDMDEQGWNNTGPALVDGLFLAPSGYTKAENGTRALVNGEDRALRGVPKPTPATTDRPQPPADRTTAEGQRFGQCLRDRPIADPGQVALGVTAKVSATSTIRLGRLGDVLVYCLDDGRPLRATASDPDELEDLRGTTVVAGAAFYDFVKNPDGSSSSSNLAAIGLVRDTRVASITYTRPGTADIAASISNGTFVLAAPLIERHPDARIVVRDAAGTVLETVEHTRGR